MALLPHGPRLRNAGLKCHISLASIFGYGRGFNDSYFVYPPHFTFNTFVGLISDGMCLKLLAYNFDKFMPASHTYLLHVYYIDIIWFCGFRSKSRSPASDKSKRSADREQSKD